MSAKDWLQESLYPTVAQTFLVKPLFEKHSAYQHIVIAENDVVGRMLVLDGVIQIAEADHAVYHEMLAHVPLMGLERPAERTLIIGGGDSCLAREVLRHPSLKSLTMVDLDQAVVEACREWLPSLTADSSDPRFEIVIADAAEYVRQAPTGAFDAILCDSSDFGGPAEVLLGAPFFAEIKRLLSPQGVAVFQSGVPFFQADTTAVTVGRLRELFGQVTIYHAAVPTYYGGDHAFVLASKSDRPFDRPREAFQGHFYNPAIHTAAFALPTWWQQKLLAANPT